MLSRLIREVLFNLVHLVLTVLVAVQNLYRRFWSSPAKTRQDEVTKSELELILKHVPQLQKKLHHLVILSDAEQQSLGDLARVVIWSMIAGVPYVTFYDTTGKLSQFEEKLFLEVETKKKGIPGCIKWSKKPDLNGYSNGYQSHTVTINIFTRNDGRPKIASCVKRIATNEIECDSSSNEMTAQDFNKALSLIYPCIPDPDLVLFTGPVCCLHGLLPWQIRLTEFVQLSVNSNISVECYLGALNKYNKCDQRFGK